MLHVTGIYLFLSGGLKQYNFLETNLGLPSASTVYKKIQCKETFLEGEIRAAELLAFLEERNLKKTVWLSEDATKIVEKVKKVVERDKNIRLCTFSDPVRSKDKQVLWIFFATG